MILTYKYKLKGKRCLQQLCRFAWAVNQVWNFCKQTQKKVERVRKEGLLVRWLSFYDLKDMAAGTSKLLGLHAQTIQSVCEVPELFTTQICSVCGAKPTSRPRGIADLGIRDWVCSECGAHHDRDVNSAQNILDLGLSALTKSQLRILAGAHQPPVEESRVAYGR